MRHDQLQWANRAAATCLVALSILSLVTMAAGWRIAAIVLSASTAAALIAVLAVLVLRRQATSPGLPAEREGQAPWLESLPSPSLLVDAGGKILALNQDSQKTRLLMDFNEKMKAL